MGVKERWAEAGLTEIPLPSGFRVRLRSLTPIDLVTRGIFPNDLVNEVRASGSSASLEADPELSARLLKAMRTAVADSIRDVWDDEANRWEPVTVTEAELDAGTFDPRDVAALMDLLTERASAREIAAAADALAGNATSADVERIAREEAGATVTGLAPFRDQPGGAAAGNDGADVPPAAVGDAARRRRRPRAGSGVGNAPGPG